MIVFSLVVACYLSMGLLTIYLCVKFFGYDTASMQQVCPAHILLLWPIILPTLMACGMFLLLFVWLKRNKR